MLTCLEGGEVKGASTRGENTPRKTSKEIGKEMGRAPNWEPESDD